METLLQDLRYGIRMLCKNPSFTVVAALTLALGIGVNTSVFTLFNAVALRPLPVKDPDRIVKVYQTFEGTFSRQFHGSPYMVSYPEYIDYRDHTDTFSGLIAYADTTLTRSGPLDFGFWILDFGLDKVSPSKIANPKSKIRTWR